MNDRLMKYQLKNNFRIILLVVFFYGLLSILFDRIALMLNMFYNPNVERLSGNIYKIVLLYFMLSPMLFYFVDFNRSLQMGVTRGQFFKSVIKTSIILVIVTTIIFTSINYMSQGKVFVGVEGLIDKLDISNTFHYSKIIPNFIYYFVYSFLMSGVMNIAILLIYKYKLKAVIGLIISFMAGATLYWNALPINHSYDIMKYMLFDLSLYLSNSIYIGLGINILISIGIFTLIRKMIRSLDEYVW